MKIIVRIFPLLLAFQSSALACTVCFGGADSNLVQGFTWGILLLLILPFSMAAGLIITVARASKKKKSHE